MERAQYMSHTMRPHPIALRETSYGNPSALDKFPSVYGLHRGSLTLVCPMEMSRGTLCQQHRD